MANKKGFGEQALLNRINIINEKNAKIAELKDEIEKIQEELKNDLTSKGIDECPVGRFTIWYQTRQRTSTDTTRLKETYESICDKYNLEKEDFSRVSSYMSFSITERRR